MNHPKTRRDFFRHAACAAVGSLGMASAYRDLCLTAAAASPFNDYKALVCVFLYGGNDQGNMVIPRGSEYATYAAGRTGLAIPEAQLLPLNVLNTPGRTFGVHPAMTGLQGLFNQGRAAIISNVGPLLAPTTRDDYRNRRVALPPSLFSHDDQQVHWQTSIPDQPATTGWGGRVADLFAALGENPQVSSLLNISDTNIFQRGQSVAQFRIGTGGVISLSNMNATTTATLNRELALPYNNLFEDGYRYVVRKSLDNGALISSALAQVTPFTTVFPNTGLGRQMQMVARLIASRSRLDMRRQIFFVSQGGYDTHGPQLTAHHNLLAELSNAMTALYNATAEIGEQSNVTQFTASDFGRTHIFNGEGSDHGWGAHHFVVGGAVRGASIYGRFPNLTVNGPDDTSQGRWIPTVSVDEYSATLARWFGVSPGRLTDIFPYLGRFANPDLGFLVG